MPEADPQPGELAAALLYEHCAVLLSRLAARGVTVPATVATLDDPIARFVALDRIRVAAADGLGVLLISSELEEILDLAGRIVVIYRGHIVGQMPRADADLERISLLMGGAAA